MQPPLVKTKPFDIQTWNKTCKSIITQYGDQHTCTGCILFPAVSTKSHCLALLKSRLLMYASEDGFKELTLNTCIWKMWPLRFFPRILLNALNLVFIFVKLSRMTSGLDLWPCTTEVIKNECQEKTFNCSCALSSISLNGCLSARLFCWPYFEWPVFV